MKRKLYDIACLRHFSEVDLLSTLDGGCEPFFEMVVACNLDELLAQCFGGKRLGCVVDVVAEPIREGVMDFIYALQHL